MAYMDKGQLSFLGRKSQRNVKSSYSPTLEAEAVVLGSKHAGLDGEPKWLKTWQAGMRPGGRAERRLMDVLTEDMNAVGVREDDAEDGVRWRQRRLAAATPGGEEPRGED